MNKPIPSSKITPSSKNKSGAARKQQKSKNSEVIEALKKALIIAQNGEMAISNINGVQYMMMSVKTLKGSLANFQKTGQFTPNIPEELKNFIKNHQLLHQLMQNLNYEIKVKAKDQSDEEYKNYIDIMNRNAIIYADLDILTFEFAQGMAESKNKRKEILKKLKMVFNKHPILETMRHGQLQKSCPAKTKVCTDIEEKK